MARNTLDLTGSRYGLWQVLGRDESRPKRWLCLCDCGAEKSVLQHTLKNGTSTRCGSGVHREGANHVRWAGIGEIPKRAFSLIKHGAESRGIDFDLTIVDLWALYETQGGACALSGVPLVLSSGKSATTHRASLDRIDSSKGYVKGNVQWVTKEVNLAKHTQTQAQFIEMCRRVVAQVEEEPSE